METEPLPQKSAFCAGGCRLSGRHGNIWMFPYRTGQYGGAAFLIPYLLFIALFGYVGLSGEFAFGRMTGTGPIGSYEFAMKSRGKKGGAILGTIPLLGSLGIAIGYAIIVGWVLRSAFGALTGSLISTEPEQFFTEMSSTNFSSVPWHTLVILLTAAVLIFGVSGGIEKINKVMMPAFFILFIIIAVRVAFLPNAIEGYKYLLVPQWEYLFNPRTWIMAMGQAFFSLSITGSGMIIYGSYLPKNEDVVHSSCMTAVLDTCAAMLAGLRHPAERVRVRVWTRPSGPKLLFITLPRVFQQMPFGRLFAFFFFISVLFAGITSLANMLEAVSEAAQTRLKLSRKAAVLLACGAALAVGLFIVRGTAHGYADGRDYHLHCADRCNPRCDYGVLGARHRQDGAGADERPQQAAQPRVCAACEVCVYLSCRTRRILQLYYPGRYWVNPVQSKRTSCGKSFFSCYFVQ